jgi:hypothetical protein
MEGCFNYFSLILNNKVKYIINYLKMKVLFLNSVKKQCGVYQYGLRVYDILKHEKDINYIYAEIEHPDQYMSLLRNNLDVISIIFNFHNSTMSWLNPTLLVPSILNMYISHESDSSMFDVKLSIDPNEQETKNLINIPRPIFENVDSMLENHIITNENIKNFIEYREDNVPVFGSFGFGFTNKGFDKIVNLINTNYDNAIIKFVIPVASYACPFTTNDMIKNLCEKQMIKPGVKLMINNDFFSSEDLLYFLKSNTMNIFLYDYMQGRGISSAIDYALSVKKPLGISDSYMFRHILNDDINLYKSSLEHVISNSATYCEQMLSLYSHDNLRNKIKKAIRDNIKKYSQAYQDIFAMKMLKYKRDGFFVDIGANHPFICNNTAILTQNFNWRGLLVEYDRQFEEHYKTRNNICYIINDASTINYEDVFKQIQAPQIIDYLSIDLEAENRSTLNTLENMYISVFNNYKFGVVTFEHDSYRGNFYDTKEKSRKIFDDKGYVLLFRDVRVFFDGQYRTFEDWYVHPDIIDNEYISKLITTESLTCEEIMNKINQL